jgi:hypothetical protein
MKLPAKLRDEAALILQICASAAPFHKDVREQFAEAECLLRCGEFP